MSSAPQSFFTRLYLSIVLTVFVSVFVTFTIVELYVQQDEVNYFYKEANLVLDYVEQQQESLQYIDDKGTIALPYPFHLEFTAKIKNNEDIHCADCEALTEINGVTIYELHEGESYATLPMRNPSQSLEIYQKLDSERSEQELADMESDPQPEPIIVLTLLSTLTLFLIIALYWPVKRLQREVKGLIESQKRFGKGQLDARASEQIQKPINELAQSFNHMAQDISSHVKEKDIFAQAIPHEVRTPLSRIQLAAGLARKHTTNLDAHNFLDDIDNYVTDINELISQIVEFSRLSNQQPTTSEQSQQVNLQNFINSRVKLFSKMTDIKVEVHLSCDRELEVDPMHLRLVLDNFIKNALNHARSAVSISCCAQNSELIHFSVADDGPGIPKEQLNTIFLPFARLDKSRNRATGGLGLGLSIAKAAALKLNGKITVAQSALGGAKFSFEQFPKD